MKIRRTIFSLIVIISMLITNVSSVYALPPMPSSFYGTVKVDGVNVPAGTTITAWINGVQYSSVTVTEYLGNTVFSMDVPGDDPATTGTIEGGVDGQTIVFRIGDLVADQSGSWHSGTNIEINLTAPGYTLTITSEHGTVTKTPDEEYYHIGEGVLLTAEADPGWAFSAWSGDLTSSTNPDTVTINGDTSVTAIFNDTNSAPTDISLSNNSVNENQPVNTVVGSLSTTDPDTGNTFTYSLVSGTGDTDNGSFNISVNNLRTSAEFDYESKSSYSIRIRSTDQGGLSVDKSFTITVTDINDAPVLDAIGNKAVNELAGLSFTATATDADVPADTLTFNLQGTVPNGASISTGGAFTWTPTETQGPGGYTFDVCVSDGTVPDCETITVTVNEVNIAPVLGAIGNKAVDELVQLSFTATATDADLPANTLTFSLSDGVGGAVPAGAAIVPGTGAFTWTPTEAQGPGDDTFDVCISDGTVSDCETITVTVNEVNVPPVLDPIGNQAVNELDELTFTATATDADLPADILSYSLEDGTGGAVPTGATIVSGTGVFTWTPTEDQGPNAYTFDVCVSDGTETVCETITVSVTETNSAPTDITLSISTVAENQAVNTVVGTLSSTDPDLGNSFTYTLVAGTGDVDNASFNIAGDSLRTSAVFDFETKSSYSIRVRSTDQGSLWVEKEFIITVTDVNEDPVITEGISTDVTMSENGTPIAFSLTLNASDQDGDTITWSISTQATNGTASASGTGISKAINYTPDLNYVGSDMFVVQVSDGNGGLDTIIINVSISLVIYTISGNAGTSGVTLSYTDGTPKTNTSGPNGDYSFNVSSNWSGTVTPSLIGYTFDPANIVYTNVLSDMPNQDYTATRITYTISGNAGVAEATLRYVDGGLQEVTAGADGEYSITVPYDWSGTVTPSSTGVVFTPANRTYTHVLADDPNEDYQRTASSFADVPFDYSVALGGTDYGLYPYIQALYDAGYTSGCGTSPLIYCPSYPLTRAQNSVFILRGYIGVDYTPPSIPDPPTFEADDWSQGTWAEKWAEGMYEEGLTAGCQVGEDPMSYCPWNPLSRVEASVYGLRLKYGPSYLPPPAVGDLFADTEDFETLEIGWALKWAEQAYLDELLPDCGTGAGGKPLFCPDLAMTRAWDAYMIVIAKDIPIILVP